MTSAARKRTEPVAGAAAFLPVRRTLPTLAAAAASCKGCDLYKRATQTVFGEGPRRARVVMVGEEPGNDEDLQGHVFVGPAGRVLDESLAAAGIDRGAVYLTNAVKHFKWEPKGKRRLHKKPTQREIWACKPWLEAELACLKPEAVVCLGATAATSLLGNEVRVTRQRGQLLAAEDRTDRDGHRASGVALARTHARRASPSAQGFRARSEAPQQGAQRRFRVV